MTQPSFRPRLLIVGADDLLRRALGRKLSTRFELVPLAIGAGAENGLRELAFDVLLVDLGLAALPALDLLRRARELAPGVPIIVMSSGAFPEHEAAALALGGVAHIVKPFGAAAIDAALERVIALAKARCAV